MDEILERCTYGQIVLLGVGAEMNARRLREDMEDEMKRQKSGGWRRPGVRTKPPKPFKQMTSAEYDEYLRNAGL